MRLFVSLLPIFIFGNLHCASMCGPLVMLIGKNPHKAWYFWGRLCSFAVVGLISAETGMALFTFLAAFHFSAIFSMTFGLWLIGLGVCSSFKLRLPGSVWLGQQTIRLSTPLVRLSAQRSRQAIFLFGLSTILLPCGQTLIVFSMIALNASPLEGLIDGCLFALFTSPALIAALRASQFFHARRHRFQPLIGCTALGVGLLTLLRGFADLNLINHLILNHKYHIVLY
jgi:uncharacterized protein